MTSTRVMARHHDMTPSEIKAARNALELSARELGFALAVHERTVFAWESGQHPIPRAVSILMRLAPQIAAVRRALGATKTKEAP